MASTHFIIWHKQGVDDGIVLDGFKIAYKGFYDDMKNTYREFYNKACKLVFTGEATNLKDGIEEDGTAWFSFVRKGQIIKTFLCDRKRAIFLLA